MTWKQLHPVYRCYCPQCERTWETTIYSPRVRRLVHGDPRGDYRRLCSYECADAVEVRLELKRLSGRVI